MSQIDDLEIARQRGLRFYVCRKEARGTRWIHLTEETEELESAIKRAKAEVAHEVAIFIETDTGGFQYWTSRFPDAFNSTVLEPD